MRSAFPIGPMTGPVPPPADTRHHRLLTTRPASGSSASQDPRATRAPSEQTTAFARHVATLLQEKQAEDVAILDVSGPLAIVDYFVLATVKNTRQAQALARELAYDAKHSQGVRKRNAGGMETEDSNWVLLDFDDVVVHLFLPEARQYYGLESLWADAPRLELPAAGDAAAPAAREQRPARPGATRFQVLPTPPEDATPPGESEG